MVVVLLIVLSPFLITDRIRDVAPATVSESVNGIKDNGRPMVFISPSVAKMTYLHRHPWTGLFGGGWWGLSLPGRFWSGSGGRTTLLAELWAGTVETALPTSRCLSATSMCCCSVTQTYLLSVSVSRHGSLWADTVLFKCSLTSCCLN